MIDILNMILGLHAIDDQHGVPSQEKIYARSLVGLRTIGCIYEVRSTESH